MYEQDFDSPLKQGGIGQNDYSTPNKAVDLNLSEEESCLCAICLSPIKLKLSIANTCQSNETELIKPSIETKCQVCRKTNDILPDEPRI